MRLNIPSDARFECLSCGRCCRTAAVPLTPDEARRLDAAPRPAGVRAVVKEAGGFGYHMHPRKGGACPFLRDDNLCAVHADLGADAKPFACRLFPLAFLETPAGLGVSLRFSCPAVAANAGPPLASRGGEIQALAREMARVARTETVGPRLPFDAKRSLPYEEAASLARDLAAIAGLEGASVVQTTCACVEYLDLVAHSNLEAPSRFRYWEGLRDGVVSRFAHRPLVPGAPPSSLQRILFRQTAFALACLSGPAALRAGLLRTTAGRFGRLAHGLVYTAGRSTLGRIRGADAVEAAVRAALSDRGDAPTVEEPLVRFFRTQLSSGAILGNARAGATLVERLSTLAMAIPFAWWFARAAAGGTPPGFGHTVEGVVRFADALATPTVVRSIHGGLTGRLFRKRRSWDALAAWAAGSEPGEPVHFVPGS